MTKHRRLRAHIAIETRTNVVTAVEVTDYNMHDSRVLRDLLKMMSKRFRMERVSGDNGYFSDSNVQAIAAYRAQTFIRLRVNTAFRRPSMQA